MNRTTLFAYLRRAPFGGRLTQSQIDGINAIVDTFNHLGLTDPRWLAYMLATAFHETGGRMQPVREGFAASDKQAMAIIEKAWKAGRMPSVKTPYWRDGFFGRGHVQLTHKRNYEIMGKILGIDLAGNPSLALDLKTSVLILIEGMTRGQSAKGDFTGKSLEQFFNDTKDDPVGARAIVNGKDKAKLIAGYHRNFLDALAAADADQPPADVSPAAAKADDVPAARSGTVWAAGTALVASGGLGVLKEAADTGATLVGAISNPWAFASLTLLAAAIGIGFWLLATGRVTINRHGA